MFDLVHSSRYNLSYQSQKRSPQNVKREIKEEKNLFKFLQRTVRLGIGYIVKNNTRKKCPECTTTVFGLFNIDNLSLSRAPKTNISLGDG